MYLDTRHQKEGGILVQEKAEVRLERGREKALVGAFMNYKPIHLLSSVFENKNDTQTKQPAD